MVVLCDLDGVIWLAHQPIPGSVDAVARLRDAGHRVLFVTNNSAATVAEQEEALARVGIPAVGDVVTSAMSGGHVLTAGERVMVCGSRGIEEAVSVKGAVSVPHQEIDEGVLVDTVMVGFHRDFDYEVMRRAATAIRRGARLVGTNDDATYPTPDGPIPGGGSILAAISTAAGVVPMVTGKPHRTMADLVCSLVPDVDAMSVMVGDRPSTDGRFATTLGCRYALVRSGVTAADAFPESHPGWFDGCRVDIDSPNLSAVVDHLLG